MKIASFAGCIVCAALFLFVGQGMAAERLAVVPVGKDSSTVVAAAVLQACAAAQTNCETVEREAIDIVLKERELKAASDAQYAEQLQKTLPVDVFVFVETREMMDQRFVRLAAVESRSGALLLSRLVPLKKTSQLTEDMAKNFLAETLRKRLTMATNGRYLAWLGVQSGVTDSQFDAPSHTLSVLVESALSSITNLALLDRSRMKHVGEEAYLSLLDQNLRNSVVLLSANLRPAGRPDVFDITWAARFPASNTATGSVVRMNADALMTGSQEIAHAITIMMAQTYLDDVPTKKASRRKEAEVLCQRAAELQKAHDMAGALEAGESAYALDPSSESRARLISCLLVKDEKDLKKILRAMDLLTLEYRKLYEKERENGITANIFWWSLRFYNAQAYEARAATAEDSAETKELLSDLAAAEERLHAARLDFGKERMSCDPNDTESYAQAWKARLNDIEGFRPGNIQAQAGLLTETIAAIKRTRRLSGVPALPMLGVFECLLTERRGVARTHTALPGITEHFARTPEGAVLFANFLDEIYNDEDPWIRMEALWIVANIEDIPAIVPDVAPDASQAKQRISKIMDVLLPAIEGEYSQTRERAAFAQEMDRFLFARSQISFFRDLTRVDPVRLEVLAGVLEKTVAVAGNNDSDLFPVYAARAKVILAKLVLERQNDRASRIIESIQNPKIRKLLMPVLQPGFDVDHLFINTPALSPQATAVSTGDIRPTTPGIKSNYTITRLKADIRCLSGSSLPNSTNSPSQLDVESGAMEYHDDLISKLHFMVDGEALHIACICEHENKLRLARLRLPDFRMTDDRAVSLRGGGMAGITLGGGNYYVATRNGLMIVNESSLAVSQLDTSCGLSDNEVSAVCWARDALFLATAGRNASLLRYDPAKGTFDDLASEKSGLTRNNMDSKGKFIIYDMAVNEKVGQLFMRVKHRSFMVAQCDLLSKNVGTMYFFHSQPLFSNSREYWPNSEHATNNTPFAYIIPSADRIWLPPLYVPPHAFPFPAQPLLALDGDTAIFSSLRRHNNYLVCDGPYLVRDNESPCRLEKADDGTSLDGIENMLKLGDAIYMFNYEGQIFEIKRKK